MQKVIIKCNNLVLGYDNKPISNPINLNIYKNEWLGIIGINGIGKSTFLKIILGIRKPISGSIKIFNKLPGYYHNIVSYIPQERELNLIKNISGKTLVKASYKANKMGFTFFTKKINKKIDELFNTFGAAHYADQEFETLSGGQKKRIYLIQALINNPSLLLLDEPLVDLDPQAKNDFINALKTVNKKQITLLIVSHDMHEIAHKLDNFIHFKKTNIHLCKTLPCLMEDKSVIL